jgi:ABC-type dipeptide/oligopeptide/nickel transport system permease subunit
VLVLLAFVVFAVFGPAFAPYDPRELRAGPPLASPSWEHPFGTNQLGQDMLSRVIAGARISAMIGFSSVLLGGGIGVLVGTVSGYFGRWVDYLIQRTGEAFTAFPALVLYLLLITALGPGVRTIIIAIAVFSLFGGSRVMRSIAIVERNQPYVMAAHSVGCSELRVFFRHIFPNVLPLAVVLISTSLGGAILAESALAFIGLGVEPGTPSWGIDMSGDNLSSARTGAWHLVVFPGIAISLVVLAANLFGDALRDIWDPRMRR